MIYRDLFDAETFDSEEGREESVHSFIHFDMGQALSAIDFEGASGIVHVVLAHTAAHLIGEEGGDFFNGRIPSVNSPAADEVAIIDRLNHARNVCRIVLSVAVESDHILTLSGFEAGVKGAGLPEVF